MTCVIGLEHKGKVYIGADSAGVQSYSIHTRIDEKVFVNDKFIFGYCGSFRMGQILRYSFTPPKKNKKDSDMCYLVNDVVDGIRKIFKKKGYIKVKEESESGGTFLLGYNGKLYVIEDDFQVGQTHDGFMAVGCGDDLALGSMYSTSNCYDPEERIKTALKAAEKFSAGVRSPFNILSI